MFDQLFVLLFDSLIVFVCLLVISCRQLPDITGSQWQLYEQARQAKQSSNAKKQTSKTIKQANKQTNKPINKQTNKRTNKQTNKRTNKQTNKDTNKQTDNQRRKNNQTN